MRCWLTQTILFHRPIFPNTPTFWFTQVPFKTIAIVALIPISSFTTTPGAYHTIELSIDTSNTSAVKDVTYTSLRIFEVPSSDIVLWPILGFRKELIQETHIFFDFLYYCCGKMARALHRRYPSLISNIRKQNLAYVLVMCGYFLVVSRFVIRVKTFQSVDETVYFRAQWRIKQYFNWILSFALRLIFRLLWNLAELCVRWNKRVTASICFKPIRFFISTDNGVRNFLQ